jgi:hypothetical protein
MQKVKRWEYISFSVATLTISSSKQYLDQTDNWKEGEQAVVAWDKEKRCWKLLSQYLNTLGTDGWELVCSTPPETNFGWTHFGGREDIPNRFFFIMKRSKE